MKTLSPIEIESAKMRLAFEKAVKTLFDTSTNFLVRVTPELAAKVLTGLKWKPHPEIESIVDAALKVANATKTTKSNPYVEFDIGMEYSLVVYVTVSNGATLSVLDQAFKNLSVMYSAYEYHSEQSAPVSACKFRLWWD